MSNIKATKSELSAKEREDLLKALKTRFEKNLNRHKGVEWAKVQARLEAKPEKMWSLSEMERTGGEPDVVGHDKKTGEYRFLRLCRRKPQRPRQPLLRPRGAGIEEGTQTEKQRSGHGRQPWASSC